MVFIQIYILSDLFFLHITKLYSVITSCCVFFATLEQMLQVSTMEDFDFGNKSYGNEEQILENGLAVIFNLINVVI